MSLLDASLSICERALYIQDWAVMGSLGKRMVVMHGGGYLQKRFAGVSDRCPIDSNKEMQVIRYTYNFSRQQINLVS